MGNSRIYVLVVVLLIAVFLSGIYLSVAVNSDFGRLQIRTISIEDDGKQLSGLMYIPNSATPENPCPAIVIAHGISESKDMMSSIGLELAKRGFIALCLDLIGHGASDGTVAEGNSEIDFGVSAAVQYLQMQAFVNSSAIGLVGHSLGGGAVRAEAAKNQNILAVVLIAGGIGANAQSPGYGVLNATYPKNLLVVVGKYDVLFNVTDLETNELPSAFNSSNPITPGVTYGSFELGSARRLVVQPTTHLFEPVDPQNVAEIVNWMENSFTPNSTIQTESNISLTYPERDGALILALIGLLGISLVSYYPIDKIFSKKSPSRITSEIKAKSKWKVYAIWWLLNLILFFPMVLIGFLISFPPLIFGSSIAWWVLATGLVGIVLFIKNKPKLWETKPAFKRFFSQNFPEKGIIIAIVAFAILFGVSSLIQAFFTVDLRILAPIFQGFTQPRRLLAFAVFVPFFLVYFLAEGSYLHATQGPKRDTLSAKVGECAKVVFVKISPFLLIIALQYLPILIFNVWLLPSFLGFITEFLWLIIPIFIITTTCSWWFYNKIGTIGSGVIFNALVLAWIAAVVFPF